MDGTSMTPFFVPPSSCGFFGNQNNQQPGLPPPSQPMWVPYPGSKRKANVSDSMDNEEFGPAPPKQFAIDDEAAEHILRNGYIITEDAKNTDDDWDESPVMTFPTQPLVPMNEGTSTVSTAWSSSVPYLGNNLAGVHEYNDEIKNDGDILHENESLPKSVEACMDSKLNDLKESPKLYFFEELMDVLSVKQSEDSVLPRSLISQSQKKSSMALVVWTPKPGISSQLGDTADNSICGTTQQASTPKPWEANQTNTTIEEKCEGDDNEDMDTTI